jgi:hypothetical protein
MSKFALVLLGLEMLLAGCGGPLTGDADAGPNPGRRVLRRPKPKRRAHHP